MPKLIRITTAPLSLKVLLANQMKYMKEHGFEVVMVSSDGKELADVLNNEQCRHHIIPMTRKMTPLADLKCLWLLYKFFRKEKPDIVHSHTPKAGLLAMLAARMAGIRIRIHTIAGLRFMTSVGTSRKILVAMEKLTGRAAKHVWPNSFSLQDYIVQHKLVGKDKLEVIGLGSSNGINLKRYSSEVLKEEKLDEIKKQINFDKNYIYFLSVGRIVNDKGIDELLRSFIEVSKQYPQCRLIIVGAFEDEVDPVSEEARQILKTHPAVIHVGWSDAVEYYMHISYALVHPSHREGFPNVLLQAGAMNCPVICSRIEGNIDIVEHEKTGLIFEVKNPKDLQKKLENALINRQLMQKYATALKKKIVDHFDQPKVHQALLKRYNELLAENS